MAIRTAEQLEDELCNYCTCDDAYKGMHLGPNGPYGCEGTRCYAAYENWKKENVGTCVICGKEAEGEYIQNRPDDEALFVCNECLASAD